MPESPQGDDVKSSCTHLYTYQWPWPTVKVTEGCKKCSGSNVLSPFLNYESTVIVCSFSLNTVRAVTPTKRVHWSAIDWRRLWGASRDNAQVSIGSRRGCRCSWSCRRGVRQWCKVMLRMTGAFCRAFAGVSRPSYPLPPLSPTLPHPFIYSLSLSFSLSRSNSPSLPSYASSLLPTPTINIPTNPTANPHRSLQKRWLGWQRGLR